MATVALRWTWWWLVAEGRHRYSLWPSTNTDRVAMGERAEQSKAAAAADKTQKITPSVRALNV